MAEDRKEEENIKPDDVTDIPHILPYAHNRGSAVIKPEDQGKIKGLALKAMYAQVDRNMVRIKEQIDLLAKQAKEIQDRVRLSEEVYLADLSFEPVIGEVYHLYKRKDESRFLSSIGPMEWRGKNQLEHLSSLRLLGDRTWEVIYYDSA